MTALRGAAHTLAIVACMVAWGFGLVWFTGCSFDAHQIEVCQEACEPRSGLDSVHPGNECSCRDGSRIYP